MNLWSVLKDIFLVIRNMIRKALGICDSEFEHSNILITVKTNLGVSLTISANKKWSIEQFKVLLAEKLSCKSEELKIIFAGRELQNSFILELSDLGNQSILHAIKVIQQNGAAEIKPANSPAKQTPLGQSLIDELDKVAIDEVSEPETSAGADAIRKVHFYVYCSTCSSIKIGKLRVCCLECKEGAFTVSRDPCGWEDVLTPKKIPGICEGQGCENAFAEIFFKCAEHQSQGESDRAVVLPLIRTNVKDVPCLACTETRDPVLVFACESTHVTCLDCFRQYCDSRLGERQFLFDPVLGYTLPCPVGCPSSLINEVHHFRIMEDNNYARYQRFGTEEFVLSAGGVLCPQPGCGMGILLDQDCKRVTCQLGCEYVFCRECLQGFHLGDCETATGGSCEEAGDNYRVNAVRAARARWEEDSHTTIRIITKPCPKCRTPTERDGGCMHMQCTRSNCNFEWCWVCQTEWTRECMGSHWFG